MCTEFTRKPSITHRKKIASLRTGTGTGTNNTSSISPPISNAKPVPNYLKPPAFSCHDACKYGHGHGHGFEPRRDVPVRPKQRGNGNGGIRGVVLNPELRVSGKKKKLKKKDDVKEDVFVDKEATFVKNVVPDNMPGSTIELEIPEEKVFELSGASTVREISVSDQEPSVNSSRDASVPFPEDSLEDSPEEVVMSTSKDKSAGIVGAKKTAKVTTGINGSERSGNGKKGEIERKNVKGVKNDKVFVKSNGTRKTGTVPKDGASIQPRFREKKYLTLTNKPRLSDKNGAKPINGEPKVTKPVKQSVVVNPPINSPRKSKTRNNTNRRNSGKSSTNSENTEEKTIYMIEEDKKEILPNNTVKKTTPKGNKLSTASSGSSASEKDRIRKKMVPKANTKPPLPPHKVSFRRGKIVDVQTETTAPPTRIKFRRANPNNAATNKGTEGAVGGRKLPRNKPIITGGAFNGVDLKPPSGSPSVVLRHQDAPPRDENGAVAAGLFNHVIEETASKLLLAETRKSKVKALVGAFETVISLQEKSGGCSPSP